MSPVRKYAPLALLTPLALVCDQLSKYLAVAHLTRGLSSGEGFWAAKHLLALRTAPVTVLQNYWDFRYAENPGAAFSFLAGVSAQTRVPFFYAVAAVATVAIGYFYVTSPDNMVVRRVALAMILGGALGNTLDRMVHGYVIDFILWHVGPHQWPVFNVADSFVSVGVVLLFLEGWLTKKLASTAVAA